MEIKYKSIEGKKQHFCNKKKNAAITMKCDKRLIGIAMMCPITNAAPMFKWHHSSNKPNYPPNVLSIHLQFLESKERKKTAKYLAVK